MVVDRGWRAVAARSAQWQSHGPIKWVPIRRRETPPGGRVGRASGHLAAEAYDGLKGTVPTWLGQRDEAVGVAEADNALGVSQDRHAVAGPFRLVAVEIEGGEERERFVERQEPLRVGVGDVERPDAGPPQLEAVRVAEVGDQRSHVGAGRALDRERRPVFLPPQRLEPRYAHLALGELDALPPACERVGALPAD